MTEVSDLEVRMRAVAGRWYTVDPSGADPQIFRSRLPPVELLRASLRPAAAAAPQQIIGTVHQRLLLDNMQRVAKHEKNTSAELCSVPYAVHRHQGV